MKLGAALLFAGILLNPLPFIGGKVPAISQAQMSGLASVEVLILVFTLSLIQVALFTKGADWIGEQVDRSRTGRWLRTKFGQRDREHRVLKVNHPVLQYICLAVLPIAPAGGMMYSALFLKEAWRLDSRLSVPLIATGNWLGFGLTYFLADTFGLLLFLAMFAGLAAVTYVANKSLQRFRNRRPALA